MAHAWTGFMRFTILNERPPYGYTWSRRRLTKRQATSRPDHLWPEIWKNMSDAAQRREKQKWAIEKPRLDNARRLRRIYFIDPKDEEFKEIPKTRVESWKFRWKRLCLAMSAKTNTRKRVAVIRARQNGHALWKPTNLREDGWKGHYQRIMKITLRRGELTL